MKDYNKQFDELIDSINKLRSDINKHFDQPGKMVGWHKNENECIVYLTGNPIYVGLEGYGFVASGEWYRLSHWIGHFTPCPPEEVEAMLIAEAKKRGYGPGVTVRRPWLLFAPQTVCLNSDYFYFDGSKNVLWCGRGGFEVFNNGQWAEVVKPAITIDRHVDRTIIHASLTEEQIQKVKEVLG